MQASMHATSRDLPISSNNQQSTRIDDDDDDDDLG
jgi:hypothetical protein